MRRKKKRFPAFPMLLVAVAVIALVATQPRDDAAIPATTVTTGVPAQQITGKLDFPSVSTSEEERPEVDQVRPAREEPARAARYVYIDMTDEELDELAEILFLEAGNQSAEGQQAVVEVVFNRVLHSGFPDTVHDVLHQGEGTDVPQFSTISLLGTVTPTQAQYDAINEALYGDTHTDPDVVFYSRSGENDRVWRKIGDHVFCREYIWE